MRNSYRQQIRILRRDDDQTQRGGGVPESYHLLAVTSAEVRDEKWSETEMNDSGRLLRTKIITMRQRDVLPDDLIVWQGDTYAIEYIDRFMNEGREMRLRVLRSTSRYSVEGENK